MAHHTHAAPTLLLIDVQRGFDDPAWGHRNNPCAERQMARLLGAWRDRGLPVVHVQHHSRDPDSPLHPSRPGHALKPETGPLPGEPVIGKKVNSAFVGTGLEELLRAAGTTALVIAGLTTDHCVSTTVRMAANLGFTVYVVSDATATFDRPGPDGVDYYAELVHDVALASLQGEFATVLSTRAAIARFAPGASVMLATAW